MGSFIYGYLGDKFGRKVLIGPSAGGVLGFAFVSAFMPSIYLVMVCRFFIGILILGHIQLGTLVMELVGSEVKYSPDYNIKGGLISEISIFYQPFQFIITPPPI